MSQVTDQQLQYGYMNATQQTEEKLQSVDFDDWKCGCGARRLDAYDGLQARKFRECASCHTRAEKLRNVEHEKLPTAYSSGTDVYRYDCLACGSTRQERRTVSATGSGSSSPGGSGGSSGGGGAGASW